MKENRIYEFDIMKGIGILLVVIGHSVTVESYIRTVIYSFHIPLFFLLSGITMEQNDDFKSIKEVILSRNRLMVNYVFYSFIYVIFDFLVRAPILEINRINALIKNVYQTVTLYGISVLWFLPTLWIGKFFASHVSNYISGNRNRFLLGSILFILCGFLAKNWVPDYSIVSGLFRLVYYPLIMLIRALSMGAFVLCGYSLKSHVKKTVKFRCGGGLSLLLVINILVGFKMNTIDYHRMVVDMIPISFLTAFSGFFGIIGLSCLIKRMECLKKFFMYLGERTLFIMVTHEYLMIKSLITVILIPVIGSGNRYLNTIIEMVMLVMIEFLLCKFVEPIIGRIFLMIQRVAGFSCKQTP